MDTYTVCLPALKAMTKSVCLQRASAIWPVPDTLWHAPASFILNWLSLRMKQSIVLRGLFSGIQITWAALYGSEIWIIFFHARKGRAVAGMTFSSELGIHFTK